MAYCAQHRKFLLVCNKRQGLQASSHFKLAPAVLADGTYWQQSTTCCLSDSSCVWSGAGH